MNSFARLSRLLLAAFLVVVAACDKSVTAPRIADAEVKEIILRTSSGDIIYSHIDHWHGAPLAPLGGFETLEIFFSSVRMSADDHDPPPFESWFTLADHPELSIIAIVEDPAVGSWTGTRVAGQLHGLAAGASRLSFVVRRGTTTLLEAPPLNFRVQ